MADQEGGFPMATGGSRRRRGHMHRGRRGRSGRSGRRHRYGGGGVADNASLVGSGGGVEGMVTDPEGVEGYGGNNPLTAMSGGHRCSIRHMRGKRTRRRAGNKSRKNKSRRYGLNFNRILGRS